MVLNVGGIYPLWFVLWMDTFIVQASFAQAEGNRPPEMPIESMEVYGSRLFDTDGLNAGLTSISQDQLEGISHEHIQQALNRIPGINLQRGNGQEYLPALRSPVLTGAGACGSLLVMEDGIPLRPTGFCNINESFEAHTEQASSIDVLMGPGTPLYGANALHGIINITTVGQESQHNTRLGLEAGADDFLRLSISAQKKNASMGLKTTLTHDGGYREAAGLDQQKISGWYRGDTSTSGFSISNLEQETAGYIEGLDAYKSRSASKVNLNPEAFRDARAARLWSSWSAAMDHNTRLVLTPYVRYSTMDFRMHFLPGDPLEENGQVSTGLHSTFYQSASTNLSTIWGLDLEYASGRLKQSQNSETMGSAFLQETIPIGRHYDYTVESFNTAAFGQLDWQAATNLSFVTGFRHQQFCYDYDNKMLAGRTREDGSECGFGGCRYSRPADREDHFNNTSIKLAANYFLNADHSFTLQFNRGFRVPQAAELYRLEREQESADLKSEHLDSISLEFQGERGQFSYELAAYWMEKANVIFRDSDFFNISNGKTRHKGIEFLILYGVTDFLLLRINGSLATHTYISHRVINNIDIFGNHVDTAPRKFGSLQFTWQITDKLSTETEWLYQGKYYTDPENLHEYPGHHLTNLRARYKQQNWEIFAVVTNLTDRRYAKRADYTSFTQERYFPGEPRAINFGVRYQW